MDLERSSLSLLAGIGIIATFFFFYLFMTDKPAIIVTIAVVLMILSIIMMLFYLFDKLKFCPMFITDTNSNLIAGMLLAVIVFIIIITLTEWAESIINGLLIIVITLLTSFTTFLFLYSLFFED